MTRLFIRFYLGVLAVLLLAWCIHGAVLKQRSAAEEARVYMGAHGGGARLAANLLRKANPEKRLHELKRLTRLFRYSIEIAERDQLPVNAYRSKDVLFFRTAENQPVVAAMIPDSDQAVVLGPFASLRLQEIERAIGGWVLLTAEQLQSTESDRDQ